MEKSFRYIPTLDDNGNIDWSKPYVRNEQEKCMTKPYAERKEYYKQYRETHREYFREYMREYIRRKRERGEALLKEVLSRKGIKNDLANG